MNILNNFSPENLAAIRKERRNNGSHVFLDLLKHFDDKLTTNEYMSLYYAHYLNEQCLSFCRKREQRSAALILEDILQIDKEQFPEFAWNGAMSAYNACLAYYDYVNEDYEQAANNLKSAMYHSRQQEAYMPYVHSLYELNLNLLRVYIKMKDEPKVVSKLTELLLSLFLDINETDELHENLANLTPAEKEDWIHYILNQVLAGFAKNDRAEAQKRLCIAVIGNILKHEAENTIKDDAWVALRTVYAYYTDDLVSFKTIVNARFDSIIAAPHFVLRIVFSGCLHALENQDVQSDPNYGNFVEALSYHGLKADGAALPIQV